MQVVTFNGESPFVYEKTFKRRVETLSRLSEADGSYRDREQRRPSMRRVLYNHNHRGNEC